MSSSYLSNTGPKSASASRAAVNGVNQKRSGNHKLNDEGKAIIKGFLSKYLDPDEEIGLQARKILLSQVAHAGNSWFTMANLYYYINQWKKTVTSKKTAHTDDGEESTLFGSIGKEVRQRLCYLFWAGISPDAHPYWASQYGISMDEMKAYLGWLQMNNHEGVIDAEKDCCLETEFFEIPSETRKKLMKLFADKPEASNDRKTLWAGRFQIDKELALAYFRHLEKVLRPDGGIHEDIRKDGAQSTNRDAGAEESKLKSEHAASENDFDRLLTPISPVPAPKFISKQPATTAEKQQDEPLAKDEQGSDKRAVDLAQTRQNTETMKERPSRTSLVKQQSSPALSSSPDNHPVRRSTEVVGARESGVTPAAPTLIEGKQMQNTRKRKHSDLTRENSVPSSQGSVRSKAQEGVLKNAARKAGDLEAGIGCVEEYIRQKSIDRDQSGAGADEIDVDEELSKSKASNKSRQISVIRDADEAPAALEYRKEGASSQSAGGIRSIDVGSPQTRSDHQMSNQKLDETFTSRDGEVGGFQSRSKDGLIDVDVAPRPKSIEELLMWMDGNQGPLDALLYLGRRFKAAAAQMSNE